MAKIYNEKDKKLITGTSSADSVYNYFSDDCTINTGAGNDSIFNFGGNYVTINTGVDNDWIQNGWWWYEGDNDIWHSGGSNVYISGGKGNDTIHNDASKVTINGEDGNDVIDNGWDGSNVYISGGKGNDTINNGYDIENNKQSNDSFGYNANVLFKYAEGDGNDIIYGFKANSTLSIGGGSYSTTKSGDNVVVTVGDGKISLMGAASLSTVHIVGEKTPIETNFWTLNGTTATYGTSSKTLVTVKGVKSVDGLNLKDKVVTVKKSSVNATKITISDGYALALADDVTKTSTKKSWSLSGTTATYNQTTVAGYKLAADSKSISYTKKASTTLTKITGVKSISGLKASGKVVTVSKAALNKAKVTISNGYTLALASDVTKTSNKKAWSLSGTTATYNQTTAAGYKLASDAKSISYTKKATKTLATINGAKKNSGFTLSGKTIKLAAASLSKKVTVSGSYAFDFASGYKNAMITGSNSNDTIKVAGANNTITGGKGNDTLTGSSGADVFVYANGDGNDVITNFGENDRISIKSGAVKISESGNNVVFTVGTGKITLNKAKGKTITYFASGKENIYPNPEPEPSDGVEYSTNGKSATLKDTYVKNKFEPSDYSDYASTLVTIDAVAVELPLKITGNAKANMIKGTGEDDSIYGGTGGDKIAGGNGNDELYGEAGNDSLFGGAGDDSLWGGVGSDTLTGGAGADVFIYNDGDGNDTVTDFDSSIDKIRVLSGDVQLLSADDSSGDVIFSVGDGQILIKNGANQRIPIYLGKSGNNVVQKY